MQFAKSGWKIMEFCCNFLFDSRILRSSICWSVAITRTFQFPIALTFSRQPDYFARCLKRKTSFVCTLQVRFLLLPFPIVSIAVWITLFLLVLITVWIYFNRLQNTAPTPSDRSPKWPVPAEEAKQMVCCSFVFYYVQRLFR